MKRIAELLTRYIRPFNKTLFYRTALIVFGVSVFVKLIIMSALYLNFGDDGLLYGESKRYYELAVHLVDGEGYYYKGNLESYRPPAYSFYLATFLALDIPLIFASVVQLLFASLIPVGVVYVVIKYLRFESFPALVAGVLAAIEPVQSFFGVVLMPDVFFTFFFLLGLLFLLRWLSMHSRHDAVLAGLALGISAYVRPAALYVAIFLTLGLVAILLLRRTLTQKRAVDLGVFIAVSFLALMPLQYRNYESFGTFSFTSMTPHTLYVYNATGSEAAARGVDYNTVYQEHMKLMREEAPNPGYPPSFLNRDFFISQSIPNLVGYPAEWALTYGLGLNTFWFSGNYHYLLAKYGFASFPNEQTSFSMLLAGGGVGAVIERLYAIGASAYIVAAVVGKLFWVCIVAGSLFGAYLLRRHPLSWIFLLTAAYFSATLLLTTIGVESRHRYAVNPLLFIFFAVTVKYLYETYFNRRSGHERRGGHSRVSAKA